MKTLQVGDVVGEYRVIGIAGSGGMGVVYKIEHVITRRVEAMKLLPAGLSVDPEQVHRFEREIQVQARLHHPNIVTLYNAIRESDSIALVMEFVEGDSLQRMVAAGPLPVDTAVNFAIQVLSALAYAHEAGVIHRDVSPANIIITPDLVAKLSDFGLALGVTDLRLSTTGVALGSPWYMSPEQVRGLEKLDARTDLYAMGAVLHEMLTGRKMFEVDGSFAVMRAHVEAVPQSPGSLNPSVSAALDAIVSKAVAKDPAMRFQSADEFRSALQSGTVGLPSPVPPLPARLGVHVSRGAVLMALVPVVLAASFFAGRHFPPKRAPLPLPTPPMLAIPSPPVLEPAVVAVAPAVPVEVPAPPPANPLARAPRKIAQAVPNTALRITGGEPLPAAPIPAPPAPAVPTNPVAVPEPAQPAAAAPSEPSATLPAAPLANPVVNPDGNGNRFVRALGKVNPFRRTKKPDPVKNQLKKDQP